MTGHNPVSTGLEPFRQENGTARNGTSVPVPSVPPPYRAERSRNPGTIAPAWLADKINNSRRDARPRTCPRCGADTLTGPDHDTVAYIATVDPLNVTAVEEVAARLAGLGSYDLVGAQLCHRDIEHIRSASRRYPVLIDHRCERTSLW